MLIKNYGLYWQAADVFWGKPGFENDGTLEGCPEHKAAEKPTNFREQAGVYVLYERFRPVYIGETGIGDQRLFKRLKSHYRKGMKGRWDSFSWFGIYPVNRISRTLRASVKVAPKIEDILYHVEAILIAAMEPPLNLQRGKFGKAERYIQTRNPNLPPSQMEMTREILQLLKSKRKT